MDFMHQTVASTIVKYFTWLFDNDGILDITHAFISYNVLVFGIIVISFFYNIFFLNIHWVKQATVYKGYKQD